MWLGEASEKMPPVTSCAEHDEKGLEDGYGGGHGRARLKNAHPLRTYEYDPREGCECSRLILWVGSWSTVAYFYVRERQQPVEQKELQRSGEQESGEGEVHLQSPGRRVRESPRSSWNPGPATNRQAGSTPVLSC